MVLLQFFNYFCKYFYGFINWKSENKSEKKNWKFSSFPSVPFCSIHLIENLKISEMLCSTSNSESSCNWRVKNGKNELKKTKWQTWKISKFLILFDIQNQKLEISQIWLLRQILTVAETEDLKTKRKMNKTVKIRSKKKKWKLPRFLSFRFCPILRIQNSDLFIFLVNIS